MCTEKDGECKIICGKDSCAHLPLIRVMKRVIGHLSEDLYICKGGPFTKLKNMTENLKSAAFWPSRVGNYEEHRVCF